LGSRRGDSGPVRRARKRGADRPIHGRDPGADRIDQVDLAPDPIEIERLTGLNPGRGDDIRPVLAEFASCAAPARVRIRENGLRMVARQLGDAKLGR
jgi:hypothetical protein